MTNKTLASGIALSGLLMLPLSLTLSSCGDDGIRTIPQQNGQHDQGSKIASPAQLLIETNQPGFQVTNILYNANNSLKSFTTDGNYITQITYAPGKVIYTTTLGGKKTSDIVYDMGNQYAVKKLETFYTSGGNVADFIVTDYYYDASGKLSKEAYRENNLPDGHVVYHYDDNNVTFQERFDADGDIVNKVSYEYYLKIADKSNHLSQFNLKMDAKLFPRFSKNLIQVKNFKKAGKNPVVTNFTYVFNNELYPVSGDVTGPYPYSWTSVWQ